MVFTAPCPTDLKQLYQTGDRLFDQGQLEIALKIFHKALEIALVFNDIEQQINTLNRIGLVYHCLGKYDTGLKFLKEALQLAKKFDCQFQVATIFNDIGKTYFLSLEYTTALQYYGQALEVFQKISHPVGIATTLNNLGETYKTIGLFDRVFHCCQKSLNIFHSIERKSINDKLIAQINIAKGLDNIGEAYFLLGRFTQAKEILELALAIRQKISKIAVKEFSNNSKFYEGNLAQKSKFIPQSEDNFSHGIIPQNRGDLTKTINLIKQVYLHLGEQQNLKLREKFSDKYQMYNPFGLPFYLRFSWN